MKIILTGGGSAGHVTPNLALIPLLLKEGWSVDYIGGADGMERGLIEPVQDVKYHGISTGKLRRYFDLKNFTDPFRVLKGVGQAVSLMGKIKPNVVFSKGGFVSVPVVYAARLRGIPVVLHESDMTPGLANKLCAPFAKVVCATFPESANAIKNGVYTGTPLRGELFDGKPENALNRFGFSGKKPILLMTGGGLGAAAVNVALREALPALLPSFDVLHLCGKGKLDPDFPNTPGYVQLEYLSDGMNDAYAAASFVVSRAGSNTICELLALKIPHLLIPLPKSGTSRGDQIDNAESFQKRGFSRVLFQQDMNAESLSAAILDAWQNRAALVRAMQNEPLSNGVEAVLAEIRRAAR